MESQHEEQQSAVAKAYELAANLMINQKKSVLETKSALIGEGLSEENASIVVANLDRQIKDAKKEAAGKDMLYGALWCLGGIAATAADFGFIFWGAIVFGAIQFIKGAFNRF